jgi:pseudouridine-5'-phosphate glycosidase
MDISSDLTELGKTPVTVISAGVKSILDIPRTLEYLVILFIAAFSHPYFCQHDCRTSFCYHCLTHMHQYQPQPDVLMFLSVFISMLIDG